MNESPGLSELAGVVFRAGNFSLGGGAPAVANLQREIVSKRKWFDDADYALCYAVPRVTPGTNLLAFYTAVGWRLRGARGALVALAAGSLPCALVAGVVTAFFDRISGNRWVVAGIDGALAASVGILLASSWLLVSPYMTRRAWPRSMAIVAGSIVLSSYVGLSPITVLLLAALTGFIP